MKNKKKEKRWRGQGTHQRQKTCLIMRHVFDLQWGAGEGQVHTEHNKHVPMDMLFVLEGGMGVMSEAGRS